MTKSVFFGIDRPYVFSYRSKIYNGITRVYNDEGVKVLKYLLTYRNSKLRRVRFPYLGIRYFYSIFTHRLSHAMEKMELFFFFAFTAVSKTCRKLNHLY